jgi:hypothetical protein
MGLDEDIITRLRKLDIGAKDSVSAKRYLFACRC